MNKDRRLIFNGLILSDSASASGQYEGYASENGSHQKEFDSVDELLDEMNMISQANTSMGYGKIRDAGVIRDQATLEKVLRSAKENQLLLIRTQYNVIGWIEAYASFTESLHKYPGLVMVGVWNEELPDEMGESPILLW